ncbi:MAG: DNA topoisomerase IV subunit A [Acidithiobacillus sp.]
MTNIEDSMDLFSDDLTNAGAIGQGTGAFAKNDVPADTKPIADTITHNAPPNIPPGTGRRPDAPDGSPPLAEYAARAYLAYAMSVVTGRAIPSLTDGQKPVQRRILYAMRDMGLHRSPKHVKSARVVGEVIGKWHPHGDTSIYDAMVRMAQSFTLRYPVVDGQGNFGSLDGDSPAAMRYTEARMMPIAELLLSELDEGTVDFRANYDGTLEEPAALPARLPFLLLNGASGIAVGMATEIPSHNLREITDACIRIVENPKITDYDILTCIPGPDFPGGGRLISSQESIRQTYLTGRGSLRVRASWDVEKLARGEWRIAIRELPPGVSTAQILAEIESLSNPQPKGEGKKKALTPEQQTLKNTMLAQIDTVRDESGKTHAVRVVIEPKSRTQNPDTLIHLLLAHTSLETNVSVNLTVLDLDGKAPCAPLAHILRQWVVFRIQTVRRRTQFRLDKALARIHILEGRLRVLLDIDAVIRVIRESDDPKADLMTHFGLSEIQADDILEIRLRQLARLAGIELEKELAEKRMAAESLHALLQDETLLRNTIASELTDDAAKYGDNRRTMIDADTPKTAQRISASLIDEPVTVIVSQKGWLRSRSGHHVDLNSLTFKDGDTMLAAFAVRTIDHLVLLDLTGRAYSIPVTQIPSGRGDGIPASSQVDMPSGSIIVTAACGPANSLWLAASNSGYGFLAMLESMIGRNRAGKAFLTLEGRERPLPLILVPNPKAEVACLSSDGRGLIFPANEIKTLPKGKGVKLMSLGDGFQIKVMALVQSGRVHGIPANRMDACRGHRAGKGRPLFG